LHNPSHEVADDAESCARRASTLLLWLFPWSEIMLNRRTLLSAAALASCRWPCPWSALAQAHRKDAIVLAMALEPVGLDPTAAAASPSPRSRCTTSTKR
jgi:hypothetical protein